MNAFERISEKVRQQQRIDEADALFLYEKADLLELGQLADSVNRTHNQRDVFYNVNRHINPTNVCAKNCKFCAFSRKPGDEGAYEYSMDEIVSRAREAVGQGATEIHMVGGLHPRWRFDHYLDILSTLQTHFPGLHVKAFTAVEIDWLAAKARLSVADTLLKLKEAGLGSMPGGGAEIFHPDIRQQICDTKTTAERWIDIHRTAHSLGLRSNCTMLYGHIEKPWHRVDHMRRLRELQDETHGFNIFIPLAFQPQDNDMGIERYTPGIDDLRTIAVARIYLDNFKHIKAYWIMLGQDIAQIALNFGANDLDGTVTEEKISRMAGGRSGMAMSKQFIHNLVRKADRIPVERDTLYHPVWRDQSEQAMDEQSLVERQRCSMVLYKFEHDRSLSKTDALLLAEHGDLLELANAAKHQKSEAGTHSDHAASYKAAQVIDLASEHHQRPFATVVQLVAIIRQESIKEIVGIKQLWALATQNSLSLPDLFDKLKQAGIQQVGSSLCEGEEDLTHTEIVQFHRHAHNSGLRTLAKLELNASVDGKSRIFWQRFVERAQVLIYLHRETEGLAGIYVDVAPQSAVSPAEYLRGIALTRLLFAEAGQVRIIAPFSKIPTIKSRPTQGVTAMTDPAFKIAPLCLVFGADDFGMPELDVPSTEMIWLESRSAVGATAC